MQLFKPFQTVTVLAMVFCFSFQSLAQTQSAKSNEKTEDKLKAFKLQTEAEKKAQIESFQNVKSIFIVPNRMKGTEEDKKMLEGNQIESIELRWYPNEAHLGGGLYFEALYHRQSGSRYSPIGGSFYPVRTKDGLLQPRLGFSYREWIQSTMRLKKQTKEIGNVLYRKGIAATATAAIIPVAYILVTRLAKSEKAWLGFSSIARQIVAGHKSAMFVMWFPMEIAAISATYFLFKDIADSLSVGKEYAQKEWLDSTFMLAREKATGGESVVDPRLDPGAIGKLFEKLAKETDVNLSAKDEGNQPAGSLEKDPVAAEKMSTGAVNIFQTFDFNFARESIQKFFRTYSLEDSDDKRVPRNEVESTLKIFEN